MGVAVIGEGVNGHRLAVLGDQARVDLAGEDLAGAAGGGGDDAAGQVPGSADAERVCLQHHHVIAEPQIGKDRDRRARRVIEQETVDQIDLAGPERLGEAGARQRHEAELEATRMRDLPRPVDLEAAQFAILTVGEGPAAEGQPEAELAVLDQLAAQLDVVGLRDIGGRRQEQRQDDGEQAASCHRPGPDPRASASRVWRRMPS